MSKKSIVVLVVLALFVTGLPLNAYAQDGGMLEALPACSDDELSATIEGLTIIDEGFDAIMEEFDLSSDPTDMAYAETIVVIEALSFSFWDEFYPEVPECDEAQFLSLTVGLMYDEVLTITLLANMGGWADAAGEAEAAEFFAGQALVRAEELEAMAEMLDEMTIEDLSAALSEDALPACGQVEAVAVEAALTELGETLSDVFVDTEEDSVAAFIASEVIVFGYWEEMYPVLSVCAEGELAGFLMGAILDEVNIIAGLVANAEVESAAGNTEVAEALAAAAEARGEMMLELIME